MSGQPSAESHLGDIVRRINELYQTVSQNGSIDAKAQAQLSSTARELIRSLQTPREAAQAFVWQNTVPPCWRSASDCGIAVPWPKETMTATELAELSGAEARLIGV